MNSQRLLLTLALVLGPAAGCASQSLSQGVTIVGDHIELQDHINFETAKADIKADSHDLLNRLAWVLKHNDGIASVHIHGHTDKSGDPAFNQTLSEQRAAAVMAYLKEAGVDKNMDAAGFGSDKPLCEEDTDECRTKNRRVEFVIDKS